MDVSLSRVPDSADLRRHAHGIPVLEDGQLLEGEQMLVEDRRQVFAIALSAEHQLLARAEAGEGGCHITVVDRSEEHTSELQSRGHLVCRLLLEKKNINTKSDCSIETSVPTATLTK